MGKLIIKKFEKIADKINSKIPIYKANDYIIYANGSLVVKDGVTEIKNFNIPILLKDKVKSVSMPDSVEVVGANVFKHCSKLEKIQFSNNLKIIGKSSFAWCENLESVKFPDSLQILEEESFSNCHALKNVDLGNGVKDLGEYCFSHTDLEIVNLPASCKEIKSFCFAHCEKLKTINGLDDLKFASTFIYDCAGVKKLELSNLSLTTYFMSQIKLDELKLINIDFEMPFSRIFANNQVKKVKIDTAEFDGTNLGDYLDEFNYLYGQVDGAYIILTNSKNNINKKIPYELNPFINCWAYFEDFLNEDEEITKQLKFYEIAVPTGFLSKYFWNENAVKQKLDFSKFKRVFNIIEKEWNESDSNVTFEDLNDFYCLAYNLGAFSEDEELRTKVCNFLKDKLVRGELKLHRMHAQYDSLKLKGVKREFTEFYIKNFLALQEEGADFICECYNEFEQLQNKNTSNRGSQRQLKPSIEAFKKIIKEFRANRFAFSTEKEKQISIEVSKFFTSQDTFNKACEIMQEFEKSNVPKGLVQDLDALEDKTGGHFTYKWLEKDDVRNLTLGKYCNCCAHLQGAGFGIMVGSIISPSIQNLVIMKDGKIVAKSTLYVNKEKCYGVFNNIEVSYAIQPNEQAKLLSTYKRGVQAFIQKYNEENPTQTLKKVNVGLHLNDVASLLIESKDSKMLQSIDYSTFSAGRSYAGDAMREEGQACLYEEQTKVKNEEIERTI
ncbi:MAG: leucine-rich repeat protein [Clostridia bacterium]|nr:leucine-rich repeat protein [Clostridia bacterium]